MDECIACQHVIDQKLCQRCSWAQSEQVVLPEHSICAAAKTLQLLQNDLEFLRIRSMKQEIMVAPRKLRCNSTMICYELVPNDTCYDVQMQNLY